MNQILKSIKRSYVVKGLKRELKHSRAAFKQMDDRDNYQQLSLFALILMTIAGILYAANGYHVGFHTLNQWTPFFPSNSWQMITFLGDTTASLCLMLFFARRLPAVLWIILLAAFYGTIVSHGMKDFIGALRPAGFLAEDEFYLLGKAFKQGSFPSGHTLTIFILVSILYHFAQRKSTKVLLVIFGVTVGASRVMVGAHWPIDVFVGAALGIFTTLAAIYTAKRTTRIGFSQAAHYFVLSLLLVATLMMFGHNGGYPGAEWFARLLATTALAFFISEYFLVPYALSRLRRTQQTI